MERMQAELDDQVLFLLLFHWLEISLGLQGREEGVFARK